MSTRDVARYLTKLTNLALLTSINGMMASCFEWSLTMITSLAESGAVYTLLLI